MTKQVQRRRGTATQHTSFTGAEGEISVNTTNKSVHVHDGTTAGGIEAARADMTNVTDANLNARLNGNTLSSLTITSADINGGTIDGTVIGGTTAAAITGTTITGTSFATTGDMTFGDNDKAIFGAGSDLQIYHDGLHSYVKDNGTGDLKLQGNNLYLQNASGETYLGATSDGLVFLRYDNATKLTTTSTGVDVTGTVTADGLTVDGGSTSTIRITGSGQDSTEFSILEFFNSDGSLDGPQVTGKISMTGNASGVNSSLNFYTALSSTGVEGAAPTKRMTIDNNGDISFYEDTGTTPKLFWDASAEALGIGTSSPDTALTVSGGDIKATGSLRNQMLVLARTDAANDYEWQIQGGSSSDSQYLAIVDDKGGASAERLRIDSSGNLLVGKTTSNFGTAGFVASASLGVFSTRSGDQPLSLNRLSTDGDIVGFYKDGTTVGSIGNRSTALVIDSAASTGAGLDITQLAILPRKDKALNNGDISLGEGGYRYKDLYLSGGVNIVSPDTTSAAVVMFGDSADAATGSIGFWNSDDSLRFSGYNNTERARIDSSGNLLVGTTDTSLYNNTSGGGFHASANGFTEVAYESANAADPTFLVNNTGADGDIIQLRKDGTVVGSIGNSGDNLIIGSTDVGLLFNSGANEILPATTTNTSDATKSLGKSTARFKDLYLSGGVYLGGTGAANLLDDYEEGTFGIGTAGDATGGTDGNSYGQYVKVGSIVHCQLIFQVSSNFTSNQLNGLPFNPANDSVIISSLHGSGVAIYNGGICFIRLVHGTDLYTFIDSSGSTIALNTTNDPFRCVFSYVTNQ